MQTLYAVFYTTALPVAAGILVISLAQNVIYLIQLIVAFFALKDRLRVRGPSEAWKLMRDTTMPISLLVPAYNEETTVVENIRSLLTLHYPNFEIIMINDGSKDDTLEAVIAAFSLLPIERSYDIEVPHQKIRNIYGSSRHPNLTVVDKENGGKADALNAGINLSRFPLFCAVDADSLLESDALLRAVQPFSEDPERVIGVGGTVRIANGCKVRAGRVVSVDLPTDLISLFQVVEYLRAFLMARIAWSRINALMMVSGAFGIFRRRASVEVGGYDPNSVGEDMELIVKFHRHFREKKVDYEIRFIPDPVCWTEAPDSLRILARQRIRWQRGSLETFFKHVRMLGNPRYGIAGVLGFPHILLIDVLGPPVELLGYLLIPALWFLGVINWDFFAAYLALVFVFGIFVSVGSLILEELELKRYPRAGQLVLLTLIAVVENFGYRQINSVWRVVGYWQYLTGRKGKWGEMTRSGFTKV